MRFQFQINLSACITHLYVKLKGKRDWPCFIKQKDLSLSSFEGNVRILSASFFSAVKDGEYQHGRCNSILRNSIKSSVVYIVPAQCFQSLSKRIGNLYTLPHPKKILNYDYKLTVFQIFIP